MNYTLENQDYRVILRSKGAELTSLFHKPSQTEFLWQADAQYWGAACAGSVPHRWSLKSRPISRERPGVFPVTTWVCPRSAI